MLTGVTEWASKAADLEKTLSPDEAVEYAKRLNEIAQRISAASSKLTSAMLG